MRDFTSSRDNMNSSPDQSQPPSSPAESGFFFNGVNADDDPTDIGLLKKFISNTLRPQGIGGISFVEPKEIADARARIRHCENTVMHVTDGTPTGSLCGYSIQQAPPQRAPDCPVCELLDC